MVSFEGNGLRGHIFIVTLTVAFHDFADDVCFLGQVAALLDVYQVLAAGSRDLQSLQKLPWERQGDFADMVGKLTAMTDALKAAVRPKRSGALSTQAISEMLQETEEEELPELWPNFASHLPKLHPREVRAT